MKGWEWLFVVVGVLAIAYFVVVKRIDGAIGSITKELPNSDDINTIMAASPREIEDSESPSDWLNMLTGGIL